jgi:5-formyltetrahydrofolate cyclo-ligase
MSDLLQAKASLRSAVRARLKSRTAEQRAQASRQACTRLLEQSLWHRASSILAYTPLVDEVDIAMLVENALRISKTVALPQFDALAQTYRACQIKAVGQDLVSGRFGILEPASHCPSVPVNQLDLILVPGVAFDGEGRRLGRGRGFYDRLLAEVEGAKCGVAFDEQVVAEIPVAPHDVVLDCIVTPGCWLDVRAARAWR